MKKYVINLREALTLSTIRQQIIEMLRQETLNAIDISQMLSVREKEVYEHLAHISRSLKAKKQKLLFSTKVKT